VNQFSYFYRAHDRDRITDRLTDHATPLATIGRIYTVPQCSLVTAYDKFTAKSQHA